MFAHFPDFHELRVFFSTFHYSYIPPILFYFILDFILYQTSACCQGQMQIKLKILSWMLLHLFQICDIVVFGSIHCAVASTSKSCHLGHILTEYPYAASGEKGSIWHILIVSPPFWGCSCSSYSRGQPRPATLKMRGSRRYILMLLLNILRTQAYFETFTPVAFPGRLYFPAHDIQTFPRQTLIGFPSARLPELIPTCGLSNSSPA